MREKRTGTIEEVREKIKEKGLAQLIIQGG